MPGAVPITSTYALTNATLPYVLMLADHGVEAALPPDPGLQPGINVANGKITNPAGRRSGRRRVRHARRRCKLTSRLTDREGTTMTSARSKNFIGGESVAADGATEDVINPATGEAIASAPLSDAAEVDAAVAAAQDGLRDLVGRPRRRTRSLAMLKIADAIESTRR